MLIREVAVLARCSHQTVRNAVGRGEIAGHKANGVRGRWDLDEASARAWAEGYRTRPRKWQLAQAAGVSEQGHAPLEQSVGDLDLARRKAELEVEARTVRLRRERLRLGREEGDLYIAADVHGVVDRMAHASATGLRELATWAGVAIHQVAANDGVTLSESLLANFRQKLLERANVIVERVGALSNLDSEEP